MNCALADAESGVCEIAVCETCQCEVVALTIRATIATLEKFHNCLTKRVVEGDTKCTMGLQSEFER